MPPSDRLFLPLDSSRLAFLQPYLLGSLPLLVHMNHTNILALIIGCVVLGIVYLFVVETDGADLLVRLLRRHYLILFPIKMVKIFLLHLLRIRLTVHKLLILLLPLAALGITTRRLHAFHNLFLKFVMYRNYN